jgi:hypothetical protein
LVEAIAAQDGAHIPGSKRKAARVKAGGGVAVSADLVQQIRDLAA